MRRFFFLAIFGLCLSQTALADISCTPTQAIPQQNRTRMKHRIPPSVNPHVYQVTVAQMAGAPPASGVSVAGFRTSQQPIDPQENGVNADRLIVEIPQGAPYVAARNQLIQTLQRSGVSRRAGGPQIDYGSEVGAAPFGFKGADFAFLCLSDLGRRSELIPAHPWHKSSNCSMASFSDAVPIFAPRDSGAYSAISLLISSRSTR